MTGLVRKATLLTVGGLLLAGAAMAGIPSSANSTIPTCITVMDGSVPALCGGPLALFTIKDANNNAVGSVTIVLDFTTCSPDASVDECNAQPDPTIGSTGVIEGPFETLAYTADLSGQLCTSVIGSGTNVTPLASGRPVCCKIYAASQFMGTATVTVVRYDLSGDGLVGGLDGSLWVSDFFNANYNSRADYDCSGTIGGLDGSLWVASFFTWTAGLPCTLLP